MTLTLSQTAARAYEHLEEAESELYGLAKNGVRNTDGERLSLARALAEAKEAVLCIERLLARL